MAVQVAGFGLRVTRRTVAPDEWVILEGGGLAILSVSHLAG